MRREHLVDRSPWRRHRPALPDLRAPRAARAPRPRGPPGRVRLARGCGDDRRDLDVLHAFRRPVRMTEDIAAREPDDEGNALAVFKNSGFLRLWLSQVTNQIGGNMVLFGLTVIVVDSTSSNAAVSLLSLTFLVPAVLFSAVAGVYVDRIDRRTILVATNFLRGAAFVALYFAGANF